MIAHSSMVSKCVSACWNSHCIAEQMNSTGMNMNVFMVEYLVYITPNGSAGLKIGCVKNLGGVLFILGW